MSKMKISLIDSRYLNRVICLFDFCSLTDTRCFQLRTGYSNLLLLLCGPGGQNVDLRWKWKLRKAVILGSSVPSQNWRNTALPFTLRSCEHDRGIPRRPECINLLSFDHQRMLFVSWFLRLTKFKWKNAMKIFIQKDKYFLSVIGIFNTYF